MVDPYTAENVSSIAAASDGPAVQPCRTSSLDRQRLCSRPATTEVHETRTRVARSATPVRPSSSMHPLA